MNESEYKTIRQQYALLLADATLSAAQEQQLEKDAGALAVWLEATALEMPQGSKHAREGDAYQLIEVHKDKVLQSHTRMFLAKVLGTAGAVVAWGLNPLSIPAAVAAIAGMASLPSAKRAAVHTFSRAEGVIICLLAFNREVRWTRTRLEKEYQKFTASHPPFAAVAGGFVPALDNLRDNVKCLEENGDDGIFRLIEEVRDLRA